MTDSDPVAAGRFLIAANGDLDAPPASGLREWLVAQGAEVLAVFHPLEREERDGHLIVRYSGGSELARRRVRLPSWPPYTYPLDLFVPPWPPRVDAWFGFNNLLCARGLLARRAGRARRVVLWSVDFIPDRFGEGPLTGVYDRLDAYCCRHADARVELSRAALEGRNARHDLKDGEGAPAHVVPIGAWLERIPKTPEDALARRRVVFIGHLVERMGVGVFLEAIELLARRGVQVRADIAGRGPLEEELRRDASARGLDRRVTFHGFIGDHRRLEELLAACSLAVAPYQPAEDSFTRFADPSKLKSYLAAGLPTLLTDVPPNAGELAARAGAELLPCDAAAFAEAVERLLGAPEEWRRRRAAALAYSHEFDWGTLMGQAMRDLGIAHSRGVGGS
jgi:glycosyltransferase involved in cell wall biosynthesis